MAQLPPKIPNMTHNWSSFAHQRMSFISSNNNNNNNNNIANAAAIMTLNNNNNNIHHNQPHWVDEFLDFSSVRRGAHRRSISDSIAFLDPPSSLVVAEECRNSTNSNINSTINNIMSSSDTNYCFDRLDDEQLMSMFSDDISVPVPPTASSSNPSSPSDQNSNNDEKITTPLDQQQQQQQQQQQPKNEPGEVESSCKNNESSSSQANTQQPPPASNGDTIIDPKRVKR